MAAKCNIISSVISKLNGLYWGITDKSIDDKIIENYIEQLNCIDVFVVPCSNGDCPDSTVKKVCNFRILRISGTTNENSITFFIEDKNLLDGVAPFIYNWSFETKDFDNSGSINLSTATLTVKSTKKLNLLVSKITLNIIDSDGCKSTKTCYLTPQGIKCDINYKPCPPVASLKVTVKTKLCPKVSSLLVTKKQ